MKTLRRFLHLCDMGFMTRAQLDSLGFRSIGSNVSISSKASIHNPQGVSIGSNVRIDDYAVLSAGKGGIEIGDHVHIACYCGIFGRGKVSLGHFCGLSSRVVIYSSTDDYSGDFLTNPTVPEVYRNVYDAEVVLGDHVIVGTLSTIMPGVTLKDGCAVSAHSMVTRSFDRLKVIGGVPARVIKSRNDVIFAFERKLRNFEQSKGIANS